jgi:nucleoside-triphosphatase THEP1
MFILLTGKGGSGKTTACWKALPGLRASGLKLAGFISPPLLDAGGKKTGIEMLNLATGEHHTFARVVSREENPDVGVYRLESDAIDWARGVLAAALFSDIDLLVIDEIGPLELNRGTGFAFALEPLADPERIPNAIAIVRRELVNELAERLGRPDMVRVEVTPVGRGSVPAQIVKLVQATRDRAGGQA